MENSNNQKMSIHNIDTTADQKMNAPVFYILVACAVVLGVIVGLIPSKFAKDSTTKITSKSEKSVGIVDKKTFKDSAEGVLREGGIDGEGNFHLERPGGESQNAYLTSSAVDLSEFVGKKIRVWGETFSGEKAGWLMDVGLIEILK